MAVVEVRFSALPVHVRTARLVASAVARRAGVSADALDEVRFAVGEACARAVDLHQRFAADLPVVLHITDDRERFVVSVVDAGPTGEDLPDPAAGDIGSGVFDPASIAEAAPSQPDPSAPGTTPVGGNTAPDAATGADNTHPEPTGDRPADDRPAGDGPAGPDREPTDAQRSAEGVDEEAGRPTEDFLPAGFGLAVIRGLVDDLDIVPVDGGTGTRVCMSWPLGGAAGT